MKNSRLVSSIVLFIGSVLLVLIPSCSCERAAAKAEKKSGLYVINVLDKDLYDDCHLKGSINVPYEQLEKFVQDLDKDSSEIVVYCSNYMCSTSGVAAKQLAQMGFKHVWAYEGGTAEWHQMGLPVEGPCKNSYLSNKLPAPEHSDSSVSVITAQELAQKLKVAE